ncbi:methyltransferase FGSG_00040-like [Cryptomeria japonica]|uniref:methyltransferase FGSG_00040-like n=1 Tax=Cryptomeria japonica TaxID=3369 RepID=UPI0027DA22FD|nr:methyltransferase FGSG_00040-like [Cryptomeria japonica]
MKGLCMDNRTLLDLYYNRYHAQMELGRYAEALQDAENCCNRDPSDINGFKNKIRALLALGRYKEAYRLLKTRQDTEDQDFTSTYRKWATFYVDMSTPNAFKPDGDFIGPVEIRMTSNGCGRGLFATENIKATEVALISKALAVSDKVLGDPINNGLLQRLKEALSSSGDNNSILFLSHVTSIHHQFSNFLPQMSYFMKDSAEENNLSGGKGKNFCRTIYENLLLRVINRIALDNSYSPSVVRKKGMQKFISNSDLMMRFYNGVWLLPSFINHSCAPNAARMSDGDITRIHATKNIEKGQEITIPYFGVLVSYYIRQQYCQNFGFGCECKCKRCDVERKFINSDSKVHKLYSEYQVACRSEMNQRSSLLMPLLERVEDLLRNFNGDKESEAWIRSSFLVVYLAHVSSGSSNPCPPPSVITPDLVLEQAYSIFQTCPGDVQILIFCQFCLKFLKCPEDEQSSSTSPLKLIFKLMQTVCSLVYGQQREGILKAVFKNFIKDTFPNILV